jgi:hypothetical protein
VASLTRKWKRWMAISCTHGHLADPRATGAMLKFRRAYAPQTVLHLGDFVDMAALRAGARRDSDDPDHAESMADDLLAGLSFLRELEPTTTHFGNHEDRLCELAHSGSAVVSYAAGQVLGRIEDAAREMKANIVPYAGLRPEACTSARRHIVFARRDLLAIRREGSRGDSWDELRFWSHAPSRAGARTNAASGRWL